MTNFVFLNFTSITELYNYIFNLCVYQGRSVIGMIGMSASVENMKLSNINIKNYLLTEWATLSHYFVESKNSIHLFHSHNSHTMRECHANNHSSLLFCCYCRRNISPARIWINLYSIQARQIKHSSAKYFDSRFFFLSRQRIHSNSNQYQLRRMRRGKAFFCPYKIFFNGWLDFKFSYKK